MPMTNRDMRRRPGLGESRIIEIVRSLRPFMDQSGTIFHLFPKPGGPAYVELDLAVFRGALAIRYRDEYDEDLPKRESDLACDLVQAIAQAEPRREVWLRTGFLPDRTGVVLDLANEEGGLMVTTPNDIRYVSGEEPPCYFRRPDGIRPLPSALPHPDGLGVLELLQAVAPLPNMDAQLCRLAFLLSCIWPDGPYPILSLVGPPESGKGFHAKVIREIVDPVHGGLQGWPRSEEEFLEQAISLRLMVLDNLSQFPPWGVDALCRLSTGGSLRKRQLYKQRAMAATVVQNPVVTTSVDSILVTPDLVSRSMLIEFGHVPDEGRWDESAALQRVRDSVPYILHGLLSIIQRALFYRPDEIPAQSRITTMFRLMSAAENLHGWHSGSFSRAYNRVRNAGHDVILSEYAWCAEVPRLLADSGGEWIGTYNELLDQLRRRVTHRGDNFPNSAKMLSIQIQRTVHSFLDISIRFDTNYGRTRLGKQVRIYC